MITSKRPGQTEKYTSSKEYNSTPLLVDFESKQRSIGLISSPAGRIAFVQVKMAHSM